MIFCVFDKNPSFVKLMCKVSWQRSKMLIFILHWLLYGLAYKSARCWVMLFHFLFFFGHFIWVVAHSGDLLVELLRQHK